MFNIFVPHFLARCHRGREEILKELPQYYGLIVRSRIKLDKDFLDHTDGLAFIGRTGIGLEHIDLVYAKQLGIKVINTPEGSRDTVGEHALGLLLCLMNNLSRAHREVQEGKWIREGNRPSHAPGMGADMCAPVIRGMAWD